MWELTKSFRFDAAHTLERGIDTAASRRIHGHSYRAEVTVRGETEPATGMVVDFGVLERTLAEAQASLDHRLLDDVKDLGPATMENLAAWIWRRLAPVTAGLASVTILRDSQGERVVYLGPRQRNRLPVDD
jgi:6-pyruvoyltetrahydropterin/6-carboxytetrahydropterin synthase